MLQILLGQIPEAIFFALFMIFTKQLKNKRILFTVLMILEYLLLKTFIKFNIWFQFLYTFMTYMILKILYKEKSQITDIFTFTISSIILVASSVIIYIVVWKTMNNYFIALILHRIFLILFLLISKNKLPKIQKMYKVIWNRNDNRHLKMKTTTFRSLNVVLFNIIFYVLNICMIFSYVLNGGV